MDTGAGVPEFTLRDQDGTEVSLKDFAGKWLVLYFYPKDNTPGCTTEAVAFTRLLPQFQARNCEVLGVSKDSEKSHCAFRDKHQLQILLGSDPDHKVHDAYGTWQLKKMMGREYYGTVRSTFLIAPDGTLARSWEKVKAAGHAEEVLEALGELQ